jgi:hypothetical protein
MNRMACLLALVVVAPSVAAVPTPRPARADMLVGAYYFPGWDRPEHWYCLKANPRVQHPLLGYYRQGARETADWHIKWAVEHGLSFFAFDYYSESGSQMLEDALDAFLRSRFIGQFRFCLTWCNEGPPATMTAEELGRFADLVTGKYLKHPSYLRLNGKPVVMILNGYSFVAGMGVEGAREAFRDLEARCLAAGLPGVHLVFGHGGIQGAQAVDDSRAAGAQAFSLYNFPYIGTPFTGPGQPGMEAPYADLVVRGEELWQHWRNVTGGNFWPTVMPGWDRRPWTKDQDLVRTGSTPALFAQALRAARQYVNEDRIVMIEAWNEWGEGCTIEPSMEQGFAYLDRVREVFCPAAGPHRDVSPAQLGLRAPVFDVQLPAIDDWRFSRGIEGWERANTSEPEVVGGALVVTSTTDDPALLGPPTYLRCAAYRRARLRMRATPPAGSGVTAVTGQLFWSTVERATVDATSLKFRVPLDDQWHDYDLNLWSVPTWQGMTDRLRLDPVDLAGVTVALDEIRLLRR